jgi:hypothetical protein
MAQDAEAGDEEFRIELRGQDFALVRIGVDGSRSEMPLSRTSLIRLSGLIGQTIVFDLARETTPDLDRLGFMKVAGLPVDRLEVHTNVLRTAVLVHFQHKDGGVSSLSLPPEIAAVLATLLPRHIQEILDASSSSSGH